MGLGSGKILLHQYANDDPFDIECANDSEINQELMCVTALVGLEGGLPKILVQRMQILGLTCHAHRLHRIHYKFLYRTQA